MEQIEYSFSNGVYWSKYKQCRIWEGGEYGLKVRYKNHTESYKMSIGNIHNTKPTTPDLQLYRSTDGRDPWAHTWNLKCLFEEGTTLHVKILDTNEREFVYTEPEQITDEGRMIWIKPTESGSAIAWVVDKYGNESDYDTCQWKLDDTYPMGVDFQCQVDLYQVITTVSAIGLISPLLYSISYDDGATWSKYQYGNKFEYLNSGAEKTLKIKVRVSTSAGRYITTGTAKEVTVSKNIGSYTALQYIKGSGTQYIDTGIPADTIGRLEIKFNSNTIKTYNWALGASDSPTAARSGTYGIGLSSAESNNGYAHNRLVGLPFEENVVYTIDYKNSANGQNFKTTFKWNNETMSATGGANDVTSQNVYLFTLNYGGKAKTSEISSITLYYAKFYALDQTTVLKSFIPVLDNKGVPCLFDEVEGEYYYNKGTGDFVPGTYTPIEYLKGTGTQYIDTDIVVDSVDITFQYDEDYRVDNSAFGARDSGGSNRLGLITQPGGMHIMPPGYDIIPYDREKHHLTMGAQFDWIAKMDSTTYTMANHAVSTRSMWLFRENQSGVMRRGYNVKIYNCKLYKSGLLVRDFIPVIDMDGTPCLYDKVSHDFFYNAGSGDFVIGEG